MKIWGKLILLSIIIIPIIVCWKYIDSIWREETNIVSNHDGNNNNEDNPNIDIENSNGDENNDNPEIGQESTLGDPTSKIVENATIAANETKVYIAPDETSEVINTMQKNTVVTAQAFAQGWTRIKKDNITGWVLTKNVAIPSTAGDVTIGNVVGRTGIVNVSSLNVRESASTSSKILDKLTDGTDVKILELSGDWYRIKWNSLEGWVAKQYINVN